MKKVILFLVLSLTLSAVIGLAGCGGSSTTPPISVTPNSELIDGVDTDFKVVVEYNLVSSNLGVLSIGFNNACDPSGCYIEAYDMCIEDGDFLVNKGSGMHEFNVTIIPKDYGSQGDFEVLVTLTKDECYILFIPDIQQLVIGGYGICAVAAIDEEVLTFQ